MNLWCFFNCHPIPWHCLTEEKHSGKRHREAHRIRRVSRQSRIRKVEVNTAPEIQKWKFMFLLSWMGCSCNPVPQFLVCVSLFKLQIPHRQNLITSAWWGISTPGAVGHTGAREWHRLDCWEIVMKLAAASNWFPYRKALEILFNNYPPPAVCENKERPSAYGQGLPNL